MDLADRTAPSELSRRLLAEALGTALLLAVIVGSGIALDQPGGDPAVWLLAHAATVGAGLAALIALLAPVSGAHFNPAVTLGFWRTGTISAREAVAFVAVQIGGAVAGVAFANWTFDGGMLDVSSTGRSGAGLVGAEVVATFVLVLVILGLVRAGNVRMVPAAVGAWVAAAIVATSSTGFANPAVTLARMFTDSPTGIDPASVPWFVVAQLAAGWLAAATALVLFPRDMNTAEPTASKRQEHS